MVESKRGTVYLLGAGPGDPELITVRARRRLQEADVVLYDALVHPDLLELCKPSASLEFVGKRAGRASERQSDINARLVDAARVGLTVARLKGGDPYLFGRGSEEAEHLAAHDIPFEVVPGVPSPMAATAYAGISLTHRELSSSVAYVTATESPEKDASSHDWSKLATATQTLVIFMGMRQLGALMDLLVRHGRPPTTPAAVVHWASTPKQKVVVGTVADLAEKARAAGLGLPSLVLVGEVVRLRERLRWFDVGPLFGKAVLVTRAPHQAASLAALLRERGADARVAPTIAIVPPEDPEPLRRAVREVGGYDALALTSANAVERFFAAIDEDGGDARRIGRAKVVVVGAQTAAALRAHGVRADVIASEQRGEGVLDALLADLRPGSRVLLPRADEAREVLPEGLRAAGHTCDVVPVYRTVPIDDEGRARVRAECAECEAVTLTSGSTVDQLVAAVGVEALHGKVLASIGPVTSDALRRHGLSPTVEAREPSLAGLVDALATHYEGSR
ncbi:MAG: uroporphyrinogen-III C-methyltransferase [Myxococcota bacterium]|jgi:uroporphyrinogen III methyltransferase/synthase|nr:uroporphyrinogen-III C-methyltransferase [Myxococcota bacterium]